MVIAAKAAPRQNYAPAAMATFGLSSVFQGTFTCFQQGLFKVMSISRAKMAKPS